MNLKEFISETITQITEGLEDAKLRTAEYGTIINPPCVGPQDNVRISNIHSREPAQFLDFDICLTIENSDSVDTKGKLGISTISFGKDKNQAHSNENVSRIRFSIPVIFPQSKVTK